LETNGEGFHHTCIAYPSREAMHEAKAELVGQGREIVQSADMGELGEFCYFHIAEIGSLLELLYLTELPPPEKTIGSMFPRPGLIVIPTTNGRYWARSMLLMGALFRSGTAPGPHHAARIARNALSSLSDHQATASSAPSASSPSAHLQRSRETRGRLRKERETYGYHGAARSGRDELVDAHGRGVECLRDVDAPGVGVQERAHPPVGDLEVVRRRGD